MRTIKRVLIVLLVLVAAGHIATSLYQKLSGCQVPPTVSCPSDILEVSAKAPEAMLLTGVTASDPQDGDLTDQVIIGGISKLVTKDTAIVTYMVFDSDDNMGTCTRRIRYKDYQRPQFEISSPLVYSPYEDIALLNRLSATDVVDGDLSDRIRVSTLSATDHSDVYNISIQVTNSIGDTAWLQLPVVVRQTDPMAPVITLNSYLTYVDVGSSFDPLEYVQSVTVNQTHVDASQLSIEGQVDTAVADTYRLFYTYQSGSSIGMAILTVVVQ